MGNYLLSKGCLLTVNSRLRKELEGMWRLFLQAFNLELLEAAEEALQYLSAGTTHQVTVG